MIGLDTNILVRYIMQDDPAQAATASLLLEALTPDEPGFVPTVVVVELGWVLASSYDLDRTQLVAVFETLLRTEAIIVDQAETVWKAIRLFDRSDADFADCLIERGAAAAGCERTVTFDRGAAKACGMVLAS